MQSLSTPLRNKLENTVKAARDVAEDAARAAIEQLGIQLKDKPTHLDDEQVQLRIRLRAHARQLGDVRHADGQQEIDHLIVETAYEQWHRMLFARFLAENQLLMHPDGVAVSLAECDELAPDEGAANGWELAGRYASRMLPQIFRPDSPVLRLQFAPEYQKRLEKLLADVDDEVFAADDSLGWVYQFWQAKKKDEVNKSEVKIGADELPAVTQLFTEPYMVQFLLHNSLGAWWTVNHPGEPCPVDLTYLRTLEDGTPAAGTYEGWPKRLAELKLLDPSCGSGHFLVAAFLMLVAMRMQEEGLTATDACDAVLRDNIHGLEIDPRCVEIAAFALALTAWSYPDAGGFRELPELHLACSGLVVSAKREEWVALAGEDQKFRMGMGQLYDLFADAPVLGSLIRPDRLGKGSAFIAGYAEVKPLLNKALEKEAADGDCEAQELGVVAQGLTKAAELLTEKYHFLVTNVPYLGRGNQADVLMNYCDENYPDGKPDLAYSFFQRMVDLQRFDGVIALVWPQGWLFQPYLVNFRKWILHNNSISLIAGLGAGAFGAISGEVVNVSLTISSKRKFNSVGSYFALDLNNTRSIQEKCKGLISYEPNIIEFSVIKKDKKSKIPINDISSSLIKLGSFTRSIEGLSTGDKDRFIKKYWEIDKIDRNLWSLYQNSPQSSLPYTGLTEILYWENGKGYLAGYSGARIQGHEAWGKKGVLSCKMGNIRSTIYLGGLYDKTCVALTPNNEVALRSLFELSQTAKYNQIVRKIDARLCVATSVFESVPLEINPSCDQIPIPFSNDLTQWIFHGHPAPATSPLHVAVARLLGYRWPAETDEKMELSDEARHWIDRCASLDGLVDDDGIVCIPPVRGEKAASERLHNLLVVAYGDDWSPSVLSKLLAEAECAGKSLEIWLRDKFFEQHFKLFHHRPFIWHIWDGVKDGFAALVNYHKLTRQNLETLIYTYLGDWIKRQEDEIKQGVDGASIRLAAAQKLKSELEKILEGEAPYDIFVRWKPLSQQPIGWEPDLNDGVRLNIRPFFQAGILRKNPNVNWNKDRGKDVESAPWYHKFEGDRINNHHLSLAEKKEARSKL